MTPLQEEKNWSIIVYYISFK